MDMKFVTSTDFQNGVGRMLDEARKAPVGIQKHGKNSHVLMDYEEYERLKAAEELNHKIKVEAAMNESFEAFDLVYQELAK